MPMLKTTTLPSIGVMARRPAARGVNPEVSLAVRPTDAICTVSRSHGINVLIFQGIPHGTFVRTITRRVLRY